jgi:hypothetical protein
LVTDRIEIVETEYPQKKSNQNYLVKNFNPRISMEGSSWIIEGGKTLDGSDVPRVIPTM